MHKKNAGELIVVRSLTESDLGLFAAHRPTTRSKQRAININSGVAKQMLSSDMFEKSGGQIECICIFDNIRIQEPRHFGKIKKNWRLGGNMIRGKQFSHLGPKDFVLIHTIAGNDGTSPITLTFISRKTNRVVHAGLAAIVEKTLNQSMAVYIKGEPGFGDLIPYCSAFDDESSVTSSPLKEPPPLRPIAPMPREKQGKEISRKRSVHEKIRTPHILERMLAVVGHLSASAQLRFLDTIEQLASQLRPILLETGGIVRIEKNHKNFWYTLTGKKIGFVDGGLANLSMLGSAPIAARVGGYVVTPGMRGEAREHFTMLKYLIDELYSHAESGVYEDTFPDIGALRDAARITIESAGAVRMLSEEPDINCVLVHGALVNPVSRYTDIMRNGKVRHRFPDFSDSALSELLPTNGSQRSGRDRNFVSVHLDQLEFLSRSSSVICGVVERESTTSSVCRAVLDNLDDTIIRDILPIPPSKWKAWFRKAVDPSEDDEYEGQRITDSLLFRCILEPGEALRPVPIDRNDIRRAPEAWKDVIVRYPIPRISYLQVTEWSAPIRIEMFEKNLEDLDWTAKLILHCALLLPRYAFPVGLDIVDKYARIPNWMSRPINTHTTVRVLRRALDEGDTRLFDSLRRMLCGSGREWLLRPGIQH